MIFSIYISRSLRIPHLFMFHAMADRWLPYNTARKIADMWCKHSVDMTFTFDIGLTGHIRSEGFILKVIKWLD